MSRTDLVCPLCAGEVPIEVLFAEAATRDAFARLATVSLPMGAKVLQYISLFAPAKNRMTIERKVRLLLELLPHLESGEIERRGRSWPVSQDCWRAAIDQMLDMRSAGKLQLPLTSHGYLLEILASMADRNEAQQEREREAALRERRAMQPAGPTAAADLVSAAPPVRTGPPPTPGTSPLVRRMQQAQRAAALAEESTPATQKEPS